MAKPTSLFEWATDAGMTEEPSVDEKAAGFSYGQRPPPKWHNWLFNGAHQWIKYLNLSGTDELTYANTRTRTIRIPTSAFQPESTVEDGQPWLPGWRLLAQAEVGFQRGWLKRADQDVGLYAEVELPTGAELVKVTARVEGQSGGLLPDASIQLSTGVTQINSGTNVLEHLTVEKNSGSPLNSSATLEAIAAVDLPWLTAFDGSHQRLLVRFTGVGAVVVNWVQVQYRDPGPRNF